MIVILTMLSGIIIGLSLGILGAGGAILTVPVLVFFVGLDEKTAIAHSLVVVGVIAFTGTLLNLRRRGSIPDSKTLLLFAVSSAPAAAAGALVGAVISAKWQIGILVLLMIIAATRMLRASPEHSAGTASAMKLLVVGAGTGAITGLVGVGGGFLIVPALVLFASLPMVRATATSLVLIVLNTLVAAVTLIATDNAPQWHSMVLLTLCGFGIAGVVAGQFIAGRLPAQRIRHLFAWCLMLIAAFFVIRTFLAPGQELL